jgi:hypothetical protein
MTLTTTVLSIEDIPAADLERELAIRTITKAFEEALRSGNHACLETLFFMEGGVFGHSSANVSMQVLLDYADAGGWGIGPYAD